MTNERSLPLNNERNLPLNDERNLPLNNERNLPLNNKRNLPLNNERNLPLNDERNISSNDQLKEKILINKLYIFTKYLLTKKQLYYFFLNNACYFYVNCSVLTMLFVPLIIHYNHFYLTDKQKKIIIICIVLFIDCISIIVAYLVSNYQLLMYDFNVAFKDKNLGFKNILNQQIHMFNTRNFIINKIFSYVIQLFAVNNNIYTFKVNSSKKTNKLIEKKKNYIKNSSTIEASYITFNEMKEYESLKTNIFISQKDKESILLFNQLLFFFNFIICFIPTNINYIYYIIWLILKNLFISIILSFKTINFNGTNIIHNLCDWMFVDIMFFLYNNQKIYNALIKNPQVVKYIDVQYDSNLQSYILAINNPLFFKKTKIFNKIQNIDLKKNIQ